MTATAGIEPRDYQAAAITATLDAEQAGTRRQLGVAATGLGKTIIFASLARRRGGRTLVLAHRDELVSQAVDKIRQVWPGVSVGIVKAGTNEVRADVVVASVQTLSRPNRLAQLVAAWSDDQVLTRPSEPFGLVVVDEAHHATADTYRRVLDELAAGHDDGPLLLGVTATPDRGDGKGLDDLFDQIVWSYDILWGIRHGYLSDLRGLRVQLDNLDLSGVKVRRGDYEAGASGRALEAADAPKAIVAAWLEHAMGRRTLVFTPTVALAADVADAFTAAGIRAGFVSGETPIDDRRQILADYSAGRIEVLANCAVLTEGYDEPRTDCIVMARPTKSRALYTQCVGRGTRVHPEKVDCLVLDVVGATDTHSLVTIPSLFGIEAREFADRLGDGSTPVGVVVDEHEAEQVRLGRLIAQEADLFARVRRDDGLAWIKTHTDGQLPRYVLSLGGTAGSVVMRQLVDGDDQSWAVQHQTVGNGNRTLLRDSSLELCQGVGEDLARRVGVKQILDPRAPWRQRPPTPKALAAARKWRLPNPEQYKTGGDLSEALTAHIFTKTNNRKGK